MVELLLLPGAWLAGKASRSNFWHGEEERDEWRRWGKVRSKGSAMVKGRIKERGRKEKK